MNRIKALLISYIIPVLAVVSVVYGVEQAGTSNMQLCKHQYALCTSALCIPVPGDPTQAVCTCDVKEGSSMATAPCDTLQPSTDANGIKTVYSTFSFAQYLEGKKGMKCPSGTPWTWCLNKSCTVDPSNPKKAICTCDIVRTGEWTTLGGDCNTATCKTGYWSGATLSALADGNVFLSKALGLDISPVKWCPGQ